MILLILIDVEILSSQRSVSRTVPIKSEQRLLICLYEEVPGLWSQGCEQAQRRDLLSKSALSESGVLGEERAGRECAAADRSEQGVGGGVVSRRQSVVDGADAATNDGKGTAPDADAGSESG